MKHRKILNKHGVYSLRWKIIKKQNIQEISQILHNQGTLFIWNELKHKKVRKIRIVLWSTRGFMAYTEINNRGTWLRMPKGYPLPYDKVKQINERNNNFIELFTNTTQLTQLVAQDGDSQKSIAG